jgi:hypothetical protein
VSTDRDADNALRRWWAHEKPVLERKLREAYRRAHFSDETIRMLAAAAGESFRAGWRARGAALGAQGEQVPLLGKEPGA